MKLFQAKAPGPFKALGIFSGKRGLKCQVQMRPKRSTTFPRKTNSSTDVTLQSNQPTPGHIAGRRDQIPGVEMPKMNLSGILPCSVTSCRTVKINIQLLLAHSRILKKIALIKLKILEFLTEIWIEILLHAFCPIQRT